MLRFGVEYLVSLEEVSREVNHLCISSGVHTTSFLGLSTLTDEL